MNIAYTLIPIIAIAPELQLVPPTVDRPEPRIITVEGASFAWLTPTADPIMGWGDSLVFAIDPETDYQVRSGIWGHRTQIGEGVYTSGPTSYFDDDASLGFENRLDWIVYNRVVWLGWYNEFLDEFDVTPEQIAESMIRVELMIQSDMDGGK